ncbi:MAG TPA: hypothetical protein DCF44_08835 [Chitinophagaceae bacterium]|nr:hypothetical protein [Chitinophagaceae bacterium]
MTPLEIEMDKYGFIYEKDTFINAPGHIADISYAVNHVAIGFTNLKTKEFTLFNQPVDNKLK